MITTETYGCDKHGEDAYQGCALCDLEALRKDAECYHHLVGLIRANRNALAGEVLDWFTGDSHE